MGKNFEHPNLSELDCRKIILSKLKTEDFKILDYQFIPFEERNGYLGEHCCLNISFEHNSTEKNESFFVKSLPQTPSQRSFLEEINGVFKEKKFFTKFCPLLKKCGIAILEDTVPTCYYVDDENFIFEDLKNKGYEAFSPRVSLSIDCVKVALRSLAKLHASGLILEEMKNFRLTEDFAVELRESFYLETEAAEKCLVSWRTGINASIDLTHKGDMKISKEIFKEKALEGLDLQRKFITPSKRFRNTVCHADTWTKNFLFKFEEGQAVDCVIVDFQTYRYGPPAQDVLTFIYMCTDKKFREKYFDELLEFYYLELKKLIEMFGFHEVITRKEFFESCSYFKRYAITQTVTHFHVVVMSKEIADELFADPEYTRYVLFESKYDFFKIVCQKDPIYRQKNFEIITDLREYYEDELFCKMSK